MAENNKNNKNEAKEKAREVALKNLKADNLMNLASTYFVNESGQYGNAGDSAVEMFKYFPSMNSGVKGYDKSGEELDIVKNSILSSRQGKKRYTGNVSEYGIMETCAGIMKESLMNLKVEDVYKLIGLDAEVPEKYKGKYLNEFSEDKEAISAIIGTYQKYLADKTVSDALSQSSKATSKNLETILNEVPNKKRE